MTDSGHMTVLRKKAKISRSGIFEYLAREMPGLPAGTPPNAIVRVFRSEDETFDADALRSFEMLPLTITHPGSLNVDENGARIHGTTGSVATRDGDHIGVEVGLMTKEAQDRYASGMRQVSIGMQSRIIWKPGRTAQGEVFDALQVQHRGRHLSMVDRGRAKTAEIMDSMDEEKSKMTEAEIKELKDKMEALKKERDTLAGKVAAFDAASVTDETINKRVEDGVQAALVAAKERAAIVERAKKFAPKMEVTDSMTVRDILSVAIKTASPSVSLEGKSDEYVIGVFDALPTSNSPQSKNKKYIPGGISDNDRRRLFGFGGAPW